MCSVVILRRPDHAWPVLIAANRDEMADRPWLAPARHWPERAHICAGLDELAAGTWLGMNDHGVVAGVLNRVNTLGPAPGRRSRGELPLEALEHADAPSAAAALADLNPEAYRPFNLFIVDSRDAYWVRLTDASEAAGTGCRRVSVAPLPLGLSMITAYDCNDEGSPRIHRSRPQFAAAPAPEPERGDWSAWISILTDRRHDPGQGPGGAMNVYTDTGFGTVSCSLIALPAQITRRIRPIWLFAAGRSGEADFQPVLPSPSSGAIV